MSKLSKIFYNIFIYIYSGLFTAYIPIVYIKKLKRSLKNKLYRKRWSERFGNTKLRLKNSIWIHSVSVGESLSAEPLVKKLLEKNPSRHFVITTTTPTGSDIVKELYKDYKNVYHTYIPYDTKSFVAQFMARVNPKIFIIIETEIWPSILNKCFKEEIPVIISNARLSYRSFRRYMKIPFASDNLFNRISHISAQTHKDAKRFATLGVNKNNITVTGNLKYSLKIPANIEKETKEIKESINNRPTWIAASTHRGEEEIILKAHEIILNIIPTCLLILVPRHKERFNEVSGIINNYSLTQQRRTKSKSYISNETQVYLGDTMGELLNLYFLADVAFVGGSLVNNGGHNFLEPAALSKAVVTGPSLFNFRAIAESFKKFHALNIINTDQELFKIITSLLNDRDLLEKNSTAAYKAFKQNNNVVDKQFKEIQKFL